MASARKATWAKSRLVSVCTWLAECATPLLRLVKVRCCRFNKHKIKINILKKLLNIKRLTRADGLSISYYMTNFSYTSCLNYFIFGPFFCFSPGPFRSYLHRFHHWKWLHWRHRRLVEASNKVLCLVLLGVKGLIVCCCFVFHLSRRWNCWRHGDSTRVFWWRPWRTQEV